MIPTPAQLHDLAQRSQGSLREVPFAALLWALAAHTFDGVLEIRRRQLVKEIVFEDGVPVDCRSNLVHETLGRFMVAQGRLSEDDHDACLREAVRRGVRFGEVLRKRSLVGSSELFRILQQNLAKKLLDGFTWSEGDYRLGEETAEVGSPLAVRVPQLIVTGLTRFAPQTEVNAGVWPLVGRRLRLRAQPPVPLGRIKLTAPQRRVVDALCQPLEIRTAAEAADLPFDEVTRLIYALAILGAVAPADEIPDGSLPTLPEWAAEPAEGSASPPADTASPAGGGDTAHAADQLGETEARQWRDQVMDTYLAHRHEDAFDLLGLPEDAAPERIREAYLTYAHRFAPWRYRRPELASVRNEAAELFYTGARAFAELMDTEQRNTLLHRRKILAEESRARPSGFQIQTDLLDSEKQYQKGRALFDAGKLREALERLEFAADCDPQNGLYRAEAAYCRYLLHPTTGADEALEELGESLRIDPDCGLAAFYAGEIHREQGSFDQAEPLLRRANQLMAPDRRPIEALKTLARQRK